MEIKISVGEIGYGELAAILLPLMGDKLSGSEELSLRLLSGVGRLPPEMIRQTVDAMPRETKDKLLAFLINRNKDYFKQAVARTAREKGFTLELLDLELEPD